MCTKTREQRMSGRLDKFTMCPNCFAPEDAITELPSSDNDFLCTVCDQELFYDVPYTECYEQEITKLKKALRKYEGCVDEIKFMNKENERMINFVETTKNKIKEILS